MPTTSIKTTYPATFQIIDLGPEQEAIDVEVFLHKATRYAKENDPSSAAAQLTLLWEKDGAGKRIGNMLGTFCVEVIFINLKDMVETGKWVLNDARTLSYKDQISKPFGGMKRQKSEVSLLNKLIHPTRIFSNT